MQSHQRLISDILELLSGRKAWVYPSQEIIDAGGLYRLYVILLGDIVNPQGTLFGAEHDLAANALHECGLRKRAAAG